MSEDEKTTRARRGLAIYGAAVSVLSSIFWIWLWRAGKPIEDEPLLVVGLMWSPALASLLARLVQRERFGDISFRLGGRRGLWALVIGWLYPIAVATIAYGAAWQLRLAQFSPPAVGHLAARPIAHFFSHLSITLSLVTVVGLFTVAGEEIGWRGYMLTRLVDAKLPYPILLSGIIWGAWHVPLLVTGQYVVVASSPLLSTALFLVAIVIAGYFVGYFRLYSGSVWPAIVFHATWNAVIQNGFDWATPRTIWTGEAGLLVSLTALLSTIVILGVHRRQVELL